MPKIKCYWAAHAVQSFEVSEEAVEEKLDEIKRQVKEGTLTIISCSITHVLKELCVDVHRDDGSVQFLSFKNKD